MSNLQDFLANGAVKAAQDLEAALLRLPEDKRNWSAGGTARSAIDMVAEVALLNGDTANMIASRSGLVNLDLEELNRRMDELAGDWPALKARLDQSTARVAQAIREVPDEELTREITMPWGPMAMTEIMAYPYWNAKYHEGQINFIASMLGCLK